MIILFFTVLDQKMSQALIRRGLDLYKDDLKGTSSGAEGKISR